MKFLFHSLFSDPFFFTFWSFLVFVFCSFSFPFSLLLPLLTRQGHVERQTQIAPSPSLFARSCGALCSLRCPPSPRVFPSTLFFSLSLSLFFFSSSFCEMGDFLLGMPGVPALFSPQGGSSVVSEESRFGDDTTAAGSGQPIALDGLWDEMSDPDFGRGFSGGEFPFAAPQNTDLSLLLEAQRTFPEASDDGAPVGAAPVPAVPLVDSLSTPVSVDFDDSLLSDELGIHSSDAFPYPGGDEHPSSDASPLAESAMSSDASPAMQPVLLGAPEVLPTASPTKKSSSSSKKQKKARASRKRHRSPTKKEPKAQQQSSFSPPTSAITVKLEPGMTTEEALAAVTLPEMDEGPDLPADQVLTLDVKAMGQLSHKQLEQYCERLEKVRKLTTEEDRLLKRQRRLVKNRESAALSRLRKKAYLGIVEQQIALVTKDRDSLQTRVTELTEQNVSLQAEVAHLSGEGGLVALLSEQNAALQADVARLSAQLRDMGHPVGSPASLASSEVAINSEQQDWEEGEDPYSTERPGSANKRQRLSQTKKKATGFALLLVLFTFGLMFNSQDTAIGNGDSALVTDVSSSHAGGRVLAQLDTPVVDTVAKPVGYSLEVKAPSQRKRPLLTDYSGGEEKRSSVSAVVVPEFHGEGPELKRRRTSTGSEDLAAIALRSSSEGHSQQQQTARIIPHRRTTQTVDVRENATAGEFMSAVQKQVGAANNNNGELSKPEQSYVYCPEAQALSPLPALDGSGSGDNMVAILLPSSVLEGSNGGSRVDPALLQVQCQVLDYYTWPLRTPEPQRRAVVAGNGNSTEV
jgi:bZIP transcription factor